MLPHDTGDGGPDRRATVRTEHDVIGFVTRTCFKTGPPGRVGIESEWFVRPTGPHPARPAPSDAQDAGPDLARLQGLTEHAGPLPGGSRISFEPGGQLELSTACGDNLPHALDLLTCDLAHLDKVLGDDGLRRVGTGLDAAGPPRRLLHNPRYDAMERYFDARGPEGRLMMTSTAAVQVCLDAGADDTDVRRRWSLVHALAPVLVASFANSPIGQDGPTGWASTRQQIWSRLDPSRVRPARDGGTGGGTDRGTDGGPDRGTDGEPDPALQWARYALDARVMLVRLPHGPWEVDPGLTLREWVTADHGRPPPTYDDVAYHLSTLFPPVRPHGWLELRLIDALPDVLWPVAVAVSTALVDDAAAADAARDAVAGTEHLLEVAARDALRDGALRRAATRCFAAALEALPRLGADGPLVRKVADYAERYVSAGRTPGDDLLEPLDLLDPLGHRRDSA